MKPYAKLLDEYYLLSTLRPSYNRAYQMWNLVQAIMAHTHPAEQLRLEQARKRCCTYLYAQREKQRTRKQDITYDPHTHDTHARRVSLKKAKDVIRDWRIFQITPEFHNILDREIEGLILPHSLYKPLEQQLSLQHSQFERDIIHNV
jgi:hypothetical protein